MAADELTKALLVEEIAPPRKIAEALFASVNGGVPLLQALVDSGAATPEILARHLARNEAPFLRQVVPVPELVARLPRGLCERLLAIPVRRDAITGTIDVVMADPADPHPASEIGFHLGAPVRAVRAPVAAIEEALRRLRMSSRDQRASMPPPDRFQQAARAAERSQPDPYEGFSNSFPARHGSLVLEADSAPPPPAARIRTPPWGTPVHVLRENAPRRVPTDPPPSAGYGSEIPIPLTRRTAYPSILAGRTHRPPAFAESASLGEGYAFDTSGLRDVVEKTAPRIERAEAAGATGVSLPSMGQPIGSFIPGPPPLPGATGFAAFAPQLPFPEMHGILAALRNAGSRDEVLELVLTGARMVALKVALFVVKKGGYLGWVGTPEFADRAALQSVLIPLDANSIFDRAVREDLYLGPIRHDEVHAPLLRVLHHPSRDVAVVPIRVSGKTAVIILTDELGDTMIGTRRLEELARAAGEAFARIVRTRR